jgi:uncharacterized protein YkwD
MVRRSLLSVIALAATVVLTLGVGIGTSDAAGRSRGAGWSKTMLDQVNFVRATAGAPRLRWCRSLARAARAHAADQASRNSMTHFGADGSTFAERAGRAGYLDWTAVAENVAAGYRDVAAVFHGWINSSGHRANILNAGYRHFGTGRAVGRDGTTYWVQTFGTGGRCR